MRFDDAIIDQVGEAAHAVSLNSGDVLVEQGSEATEVFYLRSGRLTVTVSSPGGELVVGELTPGELIGEVAVVAGRPRTATLRAAEQSVVIAIPRASFEEWLNSRVGLADAVASKARERIDRTQVAGMIQRLVGTSDPRLVQDVLDSIEWCHLEAGQLLFEQGDASDAAYFVVSGRLVARATTETGGEIALREAGAGEVIGELGLIERAPRAATVRAARDTTLARFSSATFERLISQYPALTLHVTRGVFALLRQPHRRVDRASAITIAVAAPIDPSSVVAPIVAEVARFGATFHLSSSRVDAMLNHPGISHAGADNVGVPRLSEFLHEAEVGHDHIVYEADRDATLWSRRALRQADRSIIVASAHPDDAETRRIRAFLDQLDDTGRASSWLAVLHRAGTTQPHDTAATRRQYGVERVVHLRSDDTDGIASMARSAIGHGLGLVLGGGGARGFAHLGVFRALYELGVGVDRIGGASIGAPIGAGMALGLGPTALTDVVSRQFRKLKDYTVPVVSILKGRRIAQSIVDTLGGWDIEDLWLPFFCVSTNLTKSRLEVHRRGDLATAVRASVAIPGVLPPVPLDGDLLVDGGVLNNLPVEPMRDDRSIGEIVAVDVAPPDGPRARADFGLSVSGWRALRASMGRQRSPYPGVASVLMRTMIVGSMRDRNQLLEQQDSVELYLDLEMKGVGLLAFDEVKAVADAGYEAAMPRIEAWLAARTNSIDPTPKGV